MTNTNRNFLIDSLKNSSILEGRYENIECINYDPQLKEKNNGFFSLVFRAWDIVEEQYVAIKFFDPAMTSDQYRVQCFEREAALLEILKNKRRCLQLVSSLKDHHVELQTSSGDQTYTISFKYFVVEWLEGKIEHFFENQAQMEPVDKLVLFRDIVLSVDAIHRYEIHHRDLKPDNFRAYLDHLKRIVVAIDLGTAAHMSSGRISSDYVGFYPGHKYYTAPETICGLAGNRRIAKFTDYYALGCMLFELFSHAFFGYEIRKSRQFDRLCGTITVRLGSISDEKVLVDHYQRLIQRFKYAVSIPDFNSFSTSVPPAIKEILNKILLKLVSIDFRDRYTSLERVRQRIDLCIRILENECAQRKRIEQRMLFKENREKRIIEKDRKLKSRLKLIPRMINCND